MGDLAVQDRVNWWRRKEFEEKLERQNEHLRTLGHENVEKAFRQKYEILRDEWKIVDGHKVYRIRTVTMMGEWGYDIGKYGGYIESSANLDRSGNCWICADAVVYGDARVSGNALVQGYGKVYGNAIISDDAMVDGDVFGNAVVCDEAKVRGIVCGDAVVEGKTFVDFGGKVCKDTHMNGGRISTNISETVEELLGMEAVDGVFMLRIGGSGSHNGLYRGVYVGQMYPNINTFWVDDGKTYYASKDMLFKVNQEEYRGGYKGTIEISVKKEDIVLKGNSVYATKMKVLGNYLSGVD